MSLPPRANTIRSMDDDGVSRAYAKQMSRFQTGYDATARSLKAIAPDAASILDAATGPALSMPLIARLYPDAAITGLDISPHMLARARETLAREGIEHRVRLLQGSVYAMPVPDDSFDLVVASQLIHMLDDLPAFLAEARRVLKPGGTLAIFDFRRDVPGWYRGIAWASTRVLSALRVPMDGMGPVLAASYTSDELDHALIDAGFERRAISTGIAALRAQAS